MPRQPRKAARACFFPTLLIVCLLTGCQSFGVPGITRPFSSSRDIGTLPGEDIAGVRGPLQRALQAKGAGRNSSARDDEDDYFDEELLRTLYAEGEALYKAGDYKAAEEKFALVTKDGLTLPQRIGRFRWKNVFKNDEDENDWRQYRGSRVKEDAWFMIAESQYAQERYAYAQDSYAKLIKEFPSTRHMDKATKRLFDIAQRWLGTPEFATTDEIYVAEHAEADGGEAPPEPKSSAPGSMILVPNLTDRTRPVFDTPGRAIQSLKTIWMNDPTGPLADDALMLTATYYLRKGDYLEADHFFSILREEFPKSPHLEEAFVLGSHVKLMSYEGPLYDSRALDEAIELKQRALVNFPNAPDAERLRKEIPQLKDAKAEEIWRTAQYYGRRKNPRAVRIYCKLLLKDFPESSFAPEAERLLATLGPEPEAGSETIATRTLDDEKAALRRLIPPVPDWFRSRGDEKPLNPNDAATEAEAAEDARSRAD